MDFGIVSMLTVMLDFLPNPSHVMETQGLIGKTLGDIHVPGIIMSPESN